MCKNLFGKKAIIFGKKSIIYVSIFCITISCFVHAGLTDPETYAAMPSPVTDQKSFISWLSRTGKPAYSRYNGYAANFAVYSKYHLLSYGTPSMVPGNRYDKSHDEYAVHGFSYDEFQVTNTFFRDDTTGVSDPRKWQNISLGQDAGISWMRLTSREKDYIHKSKLFYQGKSFNDMSFSSLKLTESQCIVIAIPSWYLGFALYTKHYNSKHEIRYGTLHGNGIGGVGITGEITSSDGIQDGSHTISSNQEYIDITFMIRSAVANYTGLAKSGDIDKGGIIFNSREYEAKGSGPWNTKQTIRYMRSSSDTTKDYSRKITIKSMIWVVSSMGDLVNKEIVYTFTIIEKAKIEIKGSMSIKGAISLFDGKKTMMGYILPYNPKRFMCLESITLRIDFDCSPLPQTVVFYPLGGSVATVYVTKVNNSIGYAQYIYNLGILPSSLKWNNQRIRETYQCTASAFYNNVRTDFVIEGIDITGDIYDMVYLQTPSIN